MRIIAIGDPHFKVNNGIETDRMSTEIFRVIDDVKPNAVVVMGDILDRHESIHVSPLERATKFLYNISRRCQLFVLIGNHDRPNNSTFLTEEHPFNALKHWNDTVVVDKPLFHTLREGDKSYKCLFIPYVYPGRLMEAINVLSPIWFPGKKDDVSDLLKDVVCVFGHQEIKGCQMGAVISTIGDEWPDSYPIFISGHIHDYQRIKHNVIYTGTPLQHAFGDREDKTVSLITFNDGSVIEERIDLRLPKKKLLKMTCEEVIKLDPNSVDAGSTKIVVTGTSIELKGIGNAINIREMKRRGIKIVYKDLKQNNDAPIAPEPRKNISYVSRLYSSILNDEPLRKIYEGVFGIPVAVLRIVKAN